MFLVRMFLVFQMGLVPGNFCVQKSSGGIILASRYVISAAHCFFEKDQGIVTRILTADDIHLWIGDHNIITDGETKYTPRN